ncbi:MAG: hypothetical protein QM666_07995 [Acinetobacter sp.]
MKILRFISVCLCLILGMSNSYAYVSQQKKSDPIILTKNDRHPSSLIEKELNKQKQSNNSINSDIDNIKLLNIINLQSSQSFFAYQHERFTRFLQVLFPNHDS